MGTLPIASSDTDIKQPSSLDKLELAYEGNKTIAQVRSELRSQRSAR